LKPPGDTDTTNPIQMNFGQWYDFRMEYYENTGRAVAQLLFISFLFLAIILLFFFWGIE